MALRLLPDPVFPITPAQINPLMDNLVQLNTLDAGVNERQQFALGINFHIFDLLAKSKGAIDYRGPDGHRRMIGDAFAYSGGSPVVTRHGDLTAAHLAVDFNDTQMRLKEAGLELLPADVNTLLAMSADIAVFPPQTERRILLLLDYLSKKPLL